MIKKIFFSRYWILFSLIVILSFLLRIYKVTEYPPSLYVDEVSIGYNAYSIIESGKDEHGKFLPLWFEAFGEYKLPGYIYLTSISQFFLGASDLSVRFPSVIAGSLSVALLMLILKLLTKSSKFSLIGGLFLSVSPWHLQFSRPAYEANLALTFILLGAFVFHYLLSRNKNPLIGFVFFVLSLYTYNGSRLFIPFFIAGLVIIYCKKIKKTSYFKNSLVFFLILLFISIPFIKFSFSKEGLTRAKAVAFYHDVKIKPEDFFQNQTFLTLSKLAANYMSYFSFDFLFFKGDQIGRHSVREIGMMYIWQLPLVLYGAIYAIKRKNEADKSFLVWLIIAPISASFARPNPHGLRGFFLIVPYIYFLCVGFINFWKKLKRKRKFLILPAIFIFLYFFLSYLHIYYVHYPKITALDWNDGGKEVVKYTSSIEEKYKSILITDKFILGYIYLLFYNNDLGKLYSHMDKAKDYGKYQFIKSPFTEPLEENILYIAPVWEQRNEKKIKTIYYFNGDPAFNLWEN